VLSESVQVDSRDDVLDGLNDLGVRVRRRLGESLASISQKSLPLPKATTSSLEALKFYADSLMLGSRYEATSDALLRQAIELDPDFAMAHAELGRRYYLKPDRSTRLEAEQHIVKALGLLDRLSPRERLWIQASADDSRGERRKAADGYRAYLAQYPDDGRAWFRLGWTYMAGLREFDRAIDAFNHTIALSPRDVSAHINLATSYTGLRQYERAADMYGKAFALNSDALFGEFVNHEYGFTLVHLGRLDEAADAFTRMKAQTSSTKRARALRSMALLDMYRGRYTSAIEGLREAILIDQSNGAGVSEFRDRMFLVRALDASGQTASAAAELRNVERLASTLTHGPEWLRYLAKVEARRGRVREARRLADEMTARVSDATADSATNRTMDFDQGHVNLALGECALAEGEVDEAVRLLEAANVAQPEPDGLESLAGAYAAAGRLAEAATKYEAAIATEPFGNEAQEDWFRAHIALGDIYERLNRPGEARKMYERLLALWKDGDANLVTRNRARERLRALARE
jgi:tetratricopeptide (TPR) repeat protein